MTDEVLDLTPRIKGARELNLRAELGRDLTSEDIASLAEGRGSQPSPIKHLRDSHHRLARCLAAGMTPAQAGLQTGYSQSRISILRQDPSFRDLVEVYRKEGSEEWLEYQSMATANMIRGEKLIADALEAASDSETPLSLGELRPVLDIVSDRQDRFGFPKHTVGHNVAHDLAGKLQAARLRSGLALPPPTQGAKPAEEPVKDGD